MRAVIRAIDVVSEITRKSFLAMLTNIVKKHLQEQTFKEIRSTEKLVNDSFLDDIQDKINQRISLKYATPLKWIENWEEDPLKVNHDELKVLVVEIIDSMRTQKISEKQEKYYKYLGSRHQLNIPVPHDYLVLSNNIRVMENDLDKDEVVDELKMEELHKKCDEFFRTKSTVRFKRNLTKFEYKKIDSIIWGIRLYEAHKTDDNRLYVLKIYAEIDEAIAKLHYFKDLKTISHQGLGRCPLCQKFVNGSKKEQMICKMDVIPELQEFILEELISRLS